MKEIGQAMKVIKGNAYGDAEGLRLIRQQLDLVAKAARREALRKAADYFGGGEPCWDPDSLEVEKELRRMAEGAT